MPPRIEVVLSLRVDAHYMIRAARAVGSAIAADVVHVPVNLDRWTLMVSFAGTRMGATHSNASMTYSNVHRLLGVRAVELHEEIL